MQVVASPCSAAREGRAGEADAAPGRQRFHAGDRRRLGDLHVRKLQLIGDARDDPVLRRADHPVALGGRHDAVEVLPVRLQPVCFGYAPIPGQLLYLGALGLVDDPVVQHPVQRVQVGADEFVAVGVVGAGHDPVHRADASIHQAPAHGSLTGPLGHVAHPNRLRTQVRSVAPQLPRKLRGRPGVGQSAVGAGQRDPSLSASGLKLLVRLPEGAQPVPQVD